jgi:Tfp pilus assembly protein PilF
MQAEELFQQAHDYEARGNHSKAAAIYKQLVAATSDARFHVAYGACLQHLGHWEQSVAQLERGLPSSRTTLRQMYA